MISSMAACSAVGRLPHVSTLMHGNSLATGRTLGNVAALATLPEQSLRRFINTRYPLCITSLAVFGV